MSMLCPYATIGPRASGERGVECVLGGAAGEMGGKPSVFFTRTPPTTPSHNSAGPVPLRTDARTYRTQ